MRVDIPLVAVLLCTLVGALVGGWAAALAGSSVPSEIRRDFRSEIEAGKVGLEMLNRGQA